MSLHVAHTPQSAAPLHVDDGDLLRLADGELTAEEHAHVMGHLADCAQCSGRHSALLAVAARFRAAHQDAPLPERLMRPPWGAYGAGASHTVLAARRPASLGRRTAGIALRAGAAIAVLAVGAAAAPPLREWLGARLQRSSGNTPVGNLATDGPRAGGATRPRTSHTAEVSFVPTSATLMVSVDAVSGDSIEVRTTPAEAVHVRGRATGSEPLVVVQPDGVRLVSPRDGTTVYSVAVPPNVRFVELRDEGHLLTRLARSALDAQGPWRALLP
jgi:anti-sigma factor RsiW